MKDLIKDHINTGVLSQAFYVRIENDILPIPARVELSGVIKVVSN